MNSYFAHSTSVIDESSEIGSGTKIWHFTHVMSHSKLGENCNLGQNVVISPKVRIGNGVKIQNNVSVYTGCEIDDYVFLGPSVVFTNILNPRSAVSRQNEYIKTTVRRGATIGANATIVCGIEIGEYAFIGAGAVITKSVKPYALLVGNPAKQIGWMSRSGAKLHFDEAGSAICSESGEVYELINNFVNLKA